MDDNLSNSVVHMIEGRVHVNGCPFDQIILATGVSIEPLQSPLFQQVAAEFGAPTLDGFPLLNDSLRWVDDEDMFVLGANAMLELGPGALNLMGAMRGAKIVAEALRDVMWSTGKDGTVSSLVDGNTYSVLGLDNDGGDRSDASSDEDEPSVATPHVPIAKLAPKAAKAATASKSEHQRKRRASKPARRGRG